MISSRNLFLKRAFKRHLNIHHPHPYSSTLSSIKINTIENRNANQILSFIDLNGSYTTTNGNKFYYSTSRTCYDTASIPSSSQEFSSSTANTIDDNTSSLSSPKEMSNIENYINDKLDDTISTKVDTIPTTSKINKDESTLDKILTHKQKEEKELANILKDQSTAFQIENLTNLTPSQLHSIVSKILSLKEYTPSFVLNTIQPIIRACSMINGGAKLCENLLGKCIMQSKDLSTVFEPIPTKEMYTNTIHAWSKIGNSFGANRALQILNMMYDEYELAKSELKDGEDEEGRIKVVRPDAFHYAAVMSAFANASDDVQNAPQKAEDVLKLMNKHGIQPDIVCFNTLLTIYSRNPFKYTISKCEHIFKQVQSLYKQRQEEEDDESIDAIRPTTQTYSALIHAYSVSLKTLTKNQITEQQKQVAADRCEELLQELIDIYSEDPIGNHKLAPDRILVNIVLSTVAKSGNPARAEALLDRMYSLSSLLRATKQQNLHYDEQAALSLVPDRISYNTVIDGYAKMKNKEEHISKLISTMEGLHHSTMSDANYSILPNTATYNAYMYSHITTRSPNFAFKVQDILQTMYDNPSLRPNIISYGTALYAWSLHPNIQEACSQSLQLYNTMQQRYTTLHHNNAKPNVRCYQMIIGLLCKNNDLEQALQLLQAMNIDCNEEKTLNFTIYNYILQLCAKQGRYDIAIQLYHEIKSKSSNISLWNTHVFLNVIQSCANAVQNNDRKKNKMLKFIFEVSCDINHKLLFQSGKTHFDRQLKQHHDTILRNTMDLIKDVTFKLFSNEDDEE